MPAETCRGGQYKGISNGDIYIRTRIRLLKESRRAPAIILNSTLKTASGTDFESRRYFDTPGYYFDLELGKSFMTHGNVVKEIRGAMDAGFLCWETSGSRQNDAPMYGASVIFSNDLLDWEHSLSGYCGWMRNGDAPLVYSTKLNLSLRHLDIFVRYQYGITDFPFHHLQLGVSMQFAVLTPKYN